MRVETRLNLNIIAARLVPSLSGINPAAWNFSEAEAREKGLWTNINPMPTHDELDAEALIFEAEIAQDESDKQVKKDLIKDKDGNTKDRLDALIELLGLDV